MTSIINVTFAGPPPSTVAVDLDQLVALAEEAHDPAVNEFLAAIAGALLEDHETRSHVEAELCRVYEDTASRLHDFLLMDDRPSKAHLEVLGEGARIALRYHSGWSKWDASGCRRRFSFNAPADDTFLDVAGVGIVAILNLVKEGFLKKMFSSECPASARKREHLVRILEEVCASRQAKHLPSLLG